MQDLFSTIINMSNWFMKSSNSVLTFRLFSIFPQFWIESYLDNALIMVFGV